MEDSRALYETNEESFDSKIVKNSVKGNYVNYENIGDKKTINF